MLMKHFSVAPHIYSALDRHNACYEISTHKYTAKRVHKGCLIFQSLHLFHGNKALKR